jgi:hypothetical protein
MKNGQRLGALLAALVLSAAACGDGSSRGDDDDGTGSDTGTDTGTGTGTDDGCSEASKLIYVVDAANGLWLFDPLAKHFETIGTIDCPGAGTPYALAVSREDTVYVLFQSGAECAAVREISAVDATCIGPTPFPCGVEGFELFGMGTATDGPDSTEETLYIGSETTLAKVDTTTWTVTPIGAVDNLPDLSGNSLGELWGYLAWTTPPRVSRFDTATAAELETIPLPQLSSSGSFAFADWGGDFYLFLDEGSGSSNVYRLKNGALDLYMEDVGFEIVGADSSTCAPVSVE